MTSPKLLGRNVQRLLRRKRGLHRDALIDAVNDDDTADHARQGQWATDLAVVVPASIFLAMVNNHDPMHATVSTFAPVWR